MCAEFLLSLARDCRDHGHDEWRARSTSERLAAALILNRADWLAEMRHTIAEAIERIGTNWARAVPDVALALNDDRAFDDDRESGLPEVASEPPRKPPAATRIRVTRGGRA